MVEATGSTPAAEGDGPPRLIVDPRPLERAAGLLADVLEESSRANDRVRLAIPGGSALEAAVIAARRLGEDWGRIMLTWVDERCVPVADAESNRGAAARRGLVGAGDAAGDPLAPAIVLPLHEEGESAAESVARVADELERTFGGALDVVLLGMGADGHVASLFPSRRMPTDGLVAAIHDSPKPPSERITLTRAALRTARWTILVATGQEKRDAVTRLIGGDATLPAHGLPGLSVVTDLDLGLELDLERMSKDDPAARERAK